MLAHLSVLLWNFFRVSIPIKHGERGYLLLLCSIILRMLLVNCPFGQSFTPQAVWSASSGRDLQIQICDRAPAPRYLSAQLPDAEHEHQVHDKLPAQIPAHKWKDCVNVGVLGNVKLRFHMSSSCW